MQRGSAARGAIGAAVARRLLHPSRVAPDVVDAKRIPSTRQDVQNNRNDEELEKQATHHKNPLR